MIKKLIIIFAFVVFCPAALAVDKKELNLAFFDRFNDEYLNYYIDTALENNHNLKNRFNN